MTTTAEQGDSTKQMKSDQPSQEQGHVRVRRALVSVSNKQDLVPFARGLASMGIEIISTGGTAKALIEAGVNVMPIEQVTGFPEMMDGRVKTLHPSIHGGLLGLRDCAEHMQAMEQHGIKPIDLVCINLYPFEQAMLQDRLTFEDVIEQIDIGGPAALRSAAKNFRFVTVVTSPMQYDRVISELSANDGATTYELRHDLAAAAFSRTAEYDTAISAWLSTRRPEALPAMLRLSYARYADLRYGENPHQKAAIYYNPASKEPSVVNARQLHGKPLSYNNINDAAAALELIQDMRLLAPKRAAAAIIKHTNPCGAALGDMLGEAFERAHAGDPLAAYGGIVAVSRSIDRDAARHITDACKFLEVVVAPAIEDDALEILSKKWSQVRLLAVGKLEHVEAREFSYKSIPGGMLVQERDLLIADPDSWIHAAGPKPDARLLEDAAFTWMVAKHLSSNAVAIGRKFQLIGAGMGQVDRLAACRLALMRSGDRLSVAADQPAIAASDAFFPFPDGPETLIDGGVRCIVHPGGSKRDQETIDLCEKRGVTLLHTSIRHFKH